MITIWKYNLKMESYQEIEMPHNAEILTVQVQSNNPVLWAKVDNSVKTSEIRRFEFVPTGSEVQSPQNKYINTIQFDNGTFILHLFEILDSTHNRHADDNSIILRTMN